VTGIVFAISLLDLFGGKLMQHFGTANEYA
jgi:hypothetical protein